MRELTREQRSEVLADLRARFGNTVTRQQLLEYQTETGVLPYWVMSDTTLRAGRGVYNIGENMSAERNPVVATNLTESDFNAMDPQARLDAIRREVNLLAKVPENFPAFVAHGDYDAIETVIKSGVFCPVFISGPTGAGKSLNIRQACHKLNREYVRATISPESDEDDLIGGFRLVNGNTVFHVGPVLVAMVRGAILNLDEIDYGTSKLACVQSVLEGEPITLKRLGITLAPTKGFNVFATANTKGRGDADGKYIGTNLLNEALLDRFAMTIEQEYPDVKTERKILTRNFAAFGFKVTDHAKVVFDTLAKWAEAIRTTAADGGIEDTIATRRLCHIVKMYGIFNYDETKALIYGTNRYDERTRDAVIDLYNKLAPERAMAGAHTGDLDDMDVDTPGV